MPKKTSILTILLILLPLARPFVVQAGQNCSVGETWVNDLPGDNLDKTQTAQTLDDLWFGVRVNATLVDWFNETARPNDIAAVGVRELDLLERITAGRTQVLFASVAEAEQLVPTLADRIDIIGYDLEHWPLTPDDEQADPVAAVQRLQTLARQYDLTVGLGPDRRFALDYGTAMAPYVDRFSLQLQRLQGDPDALLAFAQPLIHNLRQANPDLEINIQLRTEGTVDQLLAIVESLKTDIDGVSIIYGPNSVAMAQEFVNQLQSGEPGIPAAATPQPTAEALPALTITPTTAEVLPSQTPSATVVPSATLVAETTVEKSDPSWLAQNAGLVGILIAFLIITGGGLIVMIRRKQKQTDAQAEADG